MPLRLRLFSIDSASRFNGPPDDSKWLIRKTRNARLHFFDRLAAFIGIGGRRSANPLA